MRLFIPLAICVLFAACGNSDSKNEALTLGGGDFTEEEFRIEVRGALAGVDSAAFCQALDGLSDSEAAQAISASQRQRGQTPKQDADPDDVTTAGEIVKEECDRIN